MDESALTQPLPQGADVPVDPYSDEGRRLLALPVTFEYGKVYWSEGRQLYVAEHFGTPAGTAGRSRSITPRVCSAGCLDPKGHANRENTTWHRSCYAEHCYVKQSLIDALKVKSTGPAYEWGPLRHRSEGAKK